MLVSIHVPLAEHDRHPLQRPLLFDSFNSRAPRGARPTARLRSSSLLTFQFTCPSRSTTLDFTGLSHFFGVSIHVPLAEHEGLDDKFQFTCPSRSTTGTISWKPYHWLFQFTCPSRSTTPSILMVMDFSTVSIHVPLAEHDPVRRIHSAFFLVSIHVPLAEHDARRLDHCGRRRCFNSRAPRGARPGISLITPPDL